MRISILLLSITLLGLGIARANCQAEYCSYYAGKRYTFTITSDRQARCPNWNPEKSDNPPLSAAMALSKAKKFIAGIKLDDGYKWEFEDLSLIEVYGWAWRAQFRLSWQRGSSTGPPRLMQCWVLMDGTVVQPTITPEK